MAEHKAVSLLVLVGLLLLCGKPAFSQITVMVPETMTVNEGDTEVVVCLSLSENLTDPNTIVVDANTEDGSAVSPDDYGTTTVMLTFSSTSSMECVTVPIVNDETVEGSQDFSIMFAINNDTMLGTDTAMLERESTTVTIEDNDAITVMFAQATYSVTEGDTVMVCAQIGTGSLDVDMSVGVSVAAGGTAVEGADFTGVMDIMFMAGGVTGCFTLMAIDDDDLEADMETVMLTLEAGGQVQIAEPTTTTVTIVDNDSVSVAITEDLNRSVMEGVGTIMVCVSVMPTAMRDVMVNLQTMDVTAMAGSDYTPLNGPLTIPAGQTMACDTITITDDAIVEGGESFTVTLTAPADDVTVTEGMGVLTVTIQADTDMVTVMVPATASVQEDDSVATICVTLTGELARDLTVSVATQDMTAMDGTHYTALTMDLTFSEATMMCVGVSILDDMVLENDVMFTLMLTTTDDSATVGNAMTVVTIVDQDSVTIGFMNPTASVNEGGNTSICVMVTAGMLGRDVMLTLTESPDSSANVPGSVTVLSGEPQACFTIDVDMDNILENPELFDITLNTGVARVTVEPDTISVTIVDTTVVTVGFTATAYDVGEGMELQVCVMLTEGLLQREVMVSVSSMNDSAVAPMDYTMVSETLTFNSTTSMGCVDVTTTENDVLEDVKRFNMHLSSTDTQVVLAPMYAFVTILEDDGVTISVDGMIQVVEGQTGDIELNITEGTLGRTLLVNATSMSGVATEGADFTPVAQVLTFTPDMTTATVQVTTANDDQINENSENFTVQFMNADSTLDSLVTLSPTQTYVTIIDAPFISRNPEDQFVLLGDTATFSVEASGFDLSYQWLFEGFELDDPLDASDDIQGVDTPTLTIGNVSMMDLGSYSCMVSSVVASVNSTEAVLDTLDPPMVNAISDNVGVLSGDDVTLNCTATSQDGLDNLNVTWETDAAVQNLPNPVETVVDDVTVTSTLTLTAVDSTYSGQYTCIVTNRVDTATMSTAVSVVTINGVENRTVTVGNDVTLFCNASSDRPLSYAWERVVGPVSPRVPFMDNPDMFLARLSGQNTSMLTIRNVAFNDAMDYRCNVSVFDELVGFAVGSLTTERAELVEGPMDVTLGVGERLELNCTGRNNSDAPNPLTFLWLRNSMFLPDAMTNEIALDEPGVVVGQLIIPEVTMQDAGSYVCRLHNREPIDTVESAPADVRVRFAPLVRIFSTRNSEIPGRVDKFAVPINDNDTLTCTVEAFPRPSVVQIIATAPNGTSTVVDELVPTNTLGQYLLNVGVTPTSLDETGTVYQCFASNDLGNNTDEITLVVQDVPEAVNHSNVVHMLVNLNSVRLTWTEPEDNNAMITGYAITYCVLQTNTTCVPETMVTVSPSITPLLAGRRVALINPPPEASIRVLIVAVNAIGTGRESDVFYFLDTFRATDGQAVNVEAVTRTATELVLTWDLPPAATAGEGVVLQQFTLTALVQGADPSTTFTVNVTEGVGNTYGATVVDLDPMTPAVPVDVQIIAQYSVPSLTTPATMETFTPLEEDEEVPPLVNIRGTPGPRSPSMVMLSWQLPSDNEFLTGIRVTVTSVSLSEQLTRRRRETTTVDLEPTATMATVPAPPFSNNTVEVDAILQPSAAAMPVSVPLISPVMIQSLQGFSGPPTDVMLIPVDFNKLNITWVTPTDPNGILSDYEILVHRVSDSMPSNGPRTITPVNRFQIADLQPNTDYRVFVIAYTNGGRNRGDLSDPVETRTTFGVAPADVMQFRTLTNGVFTVVVTPDDSYGPISYFQVIVTRTTDLNRETLDTSISSPLYYVAFQEDATAAQHTFELGTGSTSEHMNMQFNNPELDGNTDYYIFVRAFSSLDTSIAGNSAFSSVIRFTPPLNTVAIIVPIAVVALLLLVLLIVLLLVAYLTMTGAGRKRGGYAPRNGLLEDGKRKKGGASMELRRTRLFPPVLNVSTPDVFTSAGQPTTLVCEASGTPAPEVTWTYGGEALDKERFIQLADGSLFINDTDLQDEGTYVVRATNFAGESEASVRVTVLRPIPPESDADHAPIKVGEFSQKIALVRAEDDEGLEDEYAEVELDWTFSSYAAKLNINKNKNRYINIIPYDHSRVVLSLQDNTPGSDYINASFIDAYQRPNGYIASQGPIPSTFPDFWRMVWELDSPTIVMVTNLKEEDKVKCHQYWPSYGTTTYGNIQVTLKEIENLAEYSIRTFNVSPLAGQSRVPMPVREVRQFHFLVWPDHGVPQYATNLLSFRKRILKYHPEKRGPMVVHCSAGVGRTGTFITIDYMLKQMEGDGTIDIFNFVRHMRYRRNYMVQTSPQYVFIHDALLESIMCGDNSIKAPEMRAKVKEMQQVVDETGLTLFQTQFKTLSSASPPDDDFDCSIAQLPDNASKNRFQEHLPANDFRVVLSSENDQSDYICASYVDNYRERNAFIVTQGPMIATVGDFWRMMWETKSAAIVMLTELEEGEQEMCVKYWPSAVGDPSVYGGFQVELSEEEKDRGSYITRRFKLSMVDKPQESRMISQFHFTKWSKTTPPTDCRPMIDLIDELQRVQRKSGNMPITVHCDDGVGRTGAFCALYSVLERVKTEQIVDVFQAVKTLRIQRTGLLQTIEEYEFVHRAVIEFLDTFSDYQNFK